MLFSVQMSCFRCKCHVFGDLPPIQPHCLTQCSSVTNHAFPFYCSYMSQKFNAIVLLCLLWRAAAALLVRSPPSARSNYSARSMALAWRPASLRGLTKNGGERRPNDLEDQRLTGWRNASKKPPEFWCDACCAYYDFHYVLYREYEEDHILECPRCIARETYGHMSTPAGEARAQRDIEVRTKHRRPERKEWFQGVAQSMNLDARDNFSLVKQEYDKRYPPKPNPSNPRHPRPKSPRSPLASAPAEAEAALWRQSYWRAAASHGAMSITLQRQSEEIARLSAENASRDAEIAALRATVAAAPETNEQQGVGVTTGGGAMKD